MKHTSLIALFSGSLLFGAAATGQHVPDDVTETIRQITGIDLHATLDAQRQTPRGDAVLETLHRFDTVELVAPFGDELPAGLMYDITLDGEPVRLMTAQYSLFAPDFRLIVDHGDGVLEELDPGPVNSYRGVVQGEEDSWVRLTLTPGGVKAQIRREDGSVWHIQPIAGRMPGDRVRHVVYSAADVKQQPGTCGVTDEPMPPQEGGIVTGDPATGGNLFVAEIAFDADYEFFDSWYNDVNEVRAEIIQILNNVDAIYENQVSISYQLTAILIRTSTSQPYTSTDSSVLLCQFRNHWNADLSGIRRDLAHLMTGKNLDGTTVGLAWTGGINVTGDCQYSTTNNCDISGRVSYGLSEEYITDSLQAHLVAHEIGHNWNAGHCSGSCGIMAPSMPTFSGDDWFAQVSKDAIIARRNAVQCYLDSCSSGCCGRHWFPQSSGPVMNAVVFASCGSTIVPEPGSYCCVTLLIRPAVSGSVVINPVLGPVVFNNN